MNRRLTTGTLLLVAAGFLLVQLAWILTMPPATGIDEVDHVHRASSVSSGHWSYSHETLDRSVGRGDLIPVRRDIVAATEPSCKTLDYVGPANCRAHAVASGDQVLVASAAARYNPTFYVLVGYPSSLFHGDAALMAMRLVAAFLCTAMLTLAALAIRSWARTSWPLLGLFLAATPTIVYSTSIAAPNGLNVASGLALWSALLGLLYCDGTARTRRLLITIATLAAVTLVNTHTMGVVWLVLILAAVAVQRGSRRLPRVPPELRTFTRTAVALTSIATVFAISWVLLARTNSPSGEGVSFPGSWLQPTLTIGVPIWPLQAIAAFPLRNEMAPVPVYAIGLGLLLAFAIIAVLALVRGRRYGSLWTIAFVAVVSVAVPVVLSAVSYRDIGLAWQGRYEMPFTGGLLLLYGLALDRSTDRLLLPVAAAAMGLSALMNGLGQLHVAATFSGSSIAEGTGWQPPGALLIAVLTLGYATCAVYALRRPTAPPPHTVSAAAAPVVASAERQA